MTLNETSLENRFAMVSTSQGSIQSLSSLCLHYKNHHKRIAQIWLRCLQKAKVPHRLTLIYLANDIVQNAKRKNTLSFIDDFKTILKDTVPYLRDEKIKKYVERVFSIWQDRSIYDSKFTTELKNALNGTSRSSHNDSNKHGTAVADQLKGNNDLMECLNRLAQLEKTSEKIKSSDDNIVDMLTHGTLSEGDLSNPKLMDDLKTHIMTLKSEIELRNKLSRLLEDSMLTQKRLLKESEDQLTVYRSQLDYISKLRDDLG